MITRPNERGTPILIGNRRLNPLELLIDKLKRRVEKTGKTTTHYELSIDDIALEIPTYDPLRDAKYQRSCPW